MSAKLVGISVRPALHAPIETLESTMIHANRGLEGDHRRGRGVRQVTVLFKDGWDAACAELNVELPWTTRRANLLVDGLNLAEQVGTRFCVGSVVLEVTGETVPCDWMTKAYAGLREALSAEWRGGVTCKVIQEGVITVGDSVAIVQPESVA